MRFLGPVFWYDLVRVARRQPLAMWRAVYGLGLLIALFVLYATALPEALFGGRVSKADAADFARRFATVFMAVQFFVVILLTPALTANAVAEERSQNTLIFLLGTHLTNREILLGKLFTRLLQVGLLIMTGLPVLALVQFMGGVYLPQIIAEYVALALTAVTLGCLGMFCGVFVKKPQNAAWRAYQILVGYLALSLLSIWYWDLPNGLWNASAARAWIKLNPAATSFNVPWRGGGLFAPPAGSPEPELTVLEHVQDWFNVPNPYYAQLRIIGLQAVGKSLDVSLAVVLRDFAIADGSLALLLGGFAVWRLRVVAAKQTAGVTHKKKLILRPAPHPPVGERPVLWKEIYCEAKPRQRWLRVFFGRWAFSVSFLPAWFFIMLTIDNFGQLESRTLFLLRFVGTAVVGLLCLRVALHAARSIGGERDRETLDSLLTTQLTPAEIIRDKWWDSFLTGRWVFLWLLVHWCLGMMPFALHPFALAVLAIETLVYAAFAASLGLYCAVTFPKTGQALRATLLIGLIGTTLLPWGLGRVARIVTTDSRPAPPTFPYSTRVRPTQSLPEMMSLGLVPPWVLVRTTVPFGAFFQGGVWYYDPPWYEFDRGQSVGEAVVPAAVGLTIYAFATWALAVAAIRRFERTRAGPAAERHVMDRSSSMTESVRPRRPALARKGRP